jgi:glutamyl-tRNA reductase
LIQETLASRQEAARQAEVLIEAETQRFHQKSQHIAKAAHIQSWYQQAHAYRDQQVAAALHRLEHGSDAKEVIHQLAHRLTQQLLHMPMQKLKEEDNI